MRGFHNVPVVLNGSEGSSIFPLLNQRIEGLFSLAQHHVLCNRALFVRALIAGQARRLPIFEISSLLRR